jgi:hypothetical protein
MVTMFGGTIPIKMTDYPTSTSVEDQFIRAKFCTICRRRGHFAQEHNLIYGDEKYGVSNSEEGKQKTLKDFKRKVCLWKNY